MLLSLGSSWADYQVSPYRSYTKDFSRVTVWTKGAPASRPSSQPVQTQAWSRAAAPQPDVVKRPRKAIPAWSGIKDEMEYGVINRKVAVKIKHYLRAIKSEVSANRSYEHWQEHFGWADGVSEEQGGAKQVDRRHAFCSCRASSKCIAPRSRVHYRPGRDVTETIWCHLECDSLMLGHSTERPQHFFFSMLVSFSSCRTSSLTTHPLDMAAVDMVSFPYC
jgi:hypothetical protein